MDLTCDERASDSPYVETIWHSQSEQARQFISMADARSGLVITKQAGGATITVRGPETRATLAHGRAGAEFIGVRFKPGVYMPKHPPASVMNRQDLALPEAGSRTFWLDGSAWQYPTLENVSTFIDRLVRHGLLVLDPVVRDARKGQIGATSLRTVQRRFLWSAGISAGALEQIDRARYAVALLQGGYSIADTISLAGFYDQPHLTRSLRHLIGLTPAQIADANRPQQLSFLYKTTPFAAGTLWRNEQAQVGGRSEA